MTGTTHDTTVLAEVAGTLMTTDIETVEVGDIVFMGGHLVRRVWTKPTDHPIRQGPDTIYRWQGLKLHEPTDGSVSRRFFNVPAGTAVLILRPTAATN